jgi:hypothetical protein
MDRDTTNIGQKTQNKTHTENSTDEQHGLYQKPGGE